MLMKDVSRTILDMYGYLFVGKNFPSRLQSQKENK